ncbi:LOW QUALITY PROTEIN: hypothetical protein IFM47457_02168 [Aspergillus lentulus]|nr:LOW QUALITY PROTEIN: hypothetical protein IFM47457_02168 [Aspergillus lentulus]
MGNHINDLFLSEEWWSELLWGSGFIIKIEPISYHFSLFRKGYSFEAHYLILLRKPLLGPYPLPIYLKRTTLSRTERLFTKNLVSEDLERLLGGIEDTKKMDVSSAIKVDSLALSKTYHSPRTL